MTKDAVRSLRNDMDRAVCYWVVFMLSSMFMYLFFHIALSDAIGVTYIYGNNDLPTYLTTFDVAICIVVIFMANGFYVKKKSKELATILMCGGTYLQLMEFLIFQTGVLMALSIPVGIGLGRLSFPLVEAAFFYMTGQELQMASGQEPVILCWSIIGGEVLWCMLVNLGYSYRNSIYTLLHGEEKIKVRVPRFVTSGGMGYLYAGLYLGCGVLLYMEAGEPSRMMALGVTGILGLCGSIDKIVLPWLEKGGRERWTDQGEKLVYMGFFREDLKTAKLYIVLFVATADILSCMAAGTIRQEGEFALCILSFVSIIPLLTMSLMFRLATEAPKRKRQLEILREIGYTQQQRKRIVGRELLWLYGFIMTASLLYILGIVTSLTIHGLLPVMAGATLVVIFIVSLAVCGMVNYRFNSNTLGNAPIIKD